MQPHGLKMAIVEAGDLTARLPHGEAVALIDSKRLIAQHLVSPFAFC
jgi:hypothetical protein